MRQNLALIFYFSLVVTLCDRTWGMNGVVHYPTAPPDQLQAWWVPLMFAGVGLAATYWAKWVTYYCVYNDTPPPADPMARLAIDISWFVAAYLACGLFDQTRARRLAALLVVIWLIRFIAQRPRKGERCALIIISLGLAAAGFFVEVLLVRWGCMEYTRPFLCGLPAWLPGLYMNGAFMARDIARAWFGGR